jgi:hypothetical protein
MNEPVPEPPRDAPGTPDHAESGMWIGILMMVVGGGIAFLGQFVLIANIFFGIAMFVGGGILALAGVIALVVKVLADRAGAERTDRYSKEVRW